MTTVRLKSRSNFHFSILIFSVSILVVAYMPWSILLLLPLWLRASNKYYCWDYSGKIRYVKPGTGRVSAHIKVSDQLVQDIKAKATNGEKVLENFEIFIKDEQDQIVAIVTKTIYVRLKERFR